MQLIFGYAYALDIRMIKTLSRTGYLKPGFLMKMYLRQLVSRSQFCICCFRNLYQQRMPGCIYPAQYLQEIVFSHGRTACGTGVIILPYMHEDARAIACNGPWRIMVYEQAPFIIIIFAVHPFKAFPIA